MQALRRSSLSQKNQGFALVEILVSLVIFAIGMLGTAGLQLATLRSNQFTAQAAVATQLVRDYEEIVQMVPSATLSASEGSTSFSALDTNVTSTSTITDCKTVTCTSTQLTDYMLNEWKNQVTTNLPAGRAVVCRDSTPKDTSGSGEGLYRWACDGQGDMLMIKVGWAAKTAKNDKVMQTIADESRPRIVVTIFGNQKDFVATP